MTKRTKTHRKPKRVSPMKRVNYAVNELDDLLDEFETDQELKALAPYVEEDRLSSLVDRLTTIQAGY